MSRMYVNDEILQKQIDCVIGRLMKLNGTQVMFSKVPMLKDNFSRNADTVAHCLKGLKEILKPYYSNNSATELLSDANQALFSGMSLHKSTDEFIRLCDKIYMHKEVNGEIDKRNHQTIANRAVNDFIEAYCHLYLVRGKERLSEEQVEDVHTFRKRAQMHVCDSGQGGARNNVVPFLPKGV